jgi:DNA polymerase III subunit gamma/tau
MASQSLYRKWRSQTFSDLVGQEPIVRTLCHAVRDGRLAHAYLFCGPRGTGKTSAARLLAKAVNCANPHDGEPCNQCLSCREITEGRSPDVIEIDAASNNGVDNIRDLREHTNVLSSGGRYRVYVVDEVHMLSTQAFNALLKTLEEPPPHIIFVLATTEAHKVLPTVVSRCQRFNFSRFSRRTIVARIQHVAAGEGLTVEPAAAELLACAAQGGMRDALSLLDQALAFCGSEITLDAVRGMLGQADPTAVRALVEHVAAGRAPDGLQLINELVEAGADLRQLNSQIGELWRALMLARAGAPVAQIMDCGPDEAHEYAELARQFALEELTACARVFAANDTPARGLPVPQLGLELAFLDCVSIRQRSGVAAQPAAQPIGRTAPALDAPRAAQSALARSQPPMTAALPNAPRPVPTMSRPQAVPLGNPAGDPDSEVEELDLAALESADPTPTAARGEASPPRSAASREAARGDTPSPLSVGADPSPLPVEEGPGERSGAPGEPVAAVDTERDEWLRRAQQQWELVKKVCKQKKRTIAAFLNNARPIDVIPGDLGDPIEVVLAVDYDFHLKSLHAPENRTGVEWALEQVLERPCRVRLVLAASGEQEGTGGSRSATARGSRNRAEGGPTPQPQASPTSPGASGHMASPPATGHGGSGGNGHQANGVKDGAAGYTGDGWQPLVPAAPEHRGTSTSEKPGRIPPPSASALEQEARADPVVQEIMRMLPAELVEVRPIDPDEES